MRAAEAGANALGAQPYGTDLFVANIRLGTPSLVGDVLRVDPSGTITTALLSTLFLPAFPNMVGMDNNNKDLIVLETNLRGSQDFLRVYDVNLAVALATLQGPSGTFMNWFDARGDGDFYAVGGSGLFIVKRDGSTAVTLSQGAPFGNLHSCATDLATGGVAVGDITSPAKVHVVAPDGSVTTTYPMPAGVPYSMTQDHRDGTFIVGTGGTGRVFGFHPNGSVTTINPSTGTNCNAITFDRWSGNGEIVVGTNPILRMTVQGVVVTSHRGIPPISNSGMCFDRARNVVATRTGSPNRYRYDLEVPSQSGKSYVLGLSITGFTPGIPIDTRVVQLVYDNVFALSVQGLLAPFLQQNLGALDAFGHASATLDLSAFGSLLKGVKVWAAAITIDPLAPSSIGVISKPVVTVLE